MVSNESVFRHRNRCARSLQKVSRAARLRRGPSNVSMAVSERAFVAHQTLKITSKRLKNVIFSQYGATSRKIVTADSVFVKPNSLKRWNSPHQPPGDRSCIGCFPGAPKTRGQNKYRTVPTHRRQNESLYKTPRLNKYIRCSPPGTKLDRNVR